MDDHEISSAKVATEFLEEWFVSLTASNVANINFSEERCQSVRFKSRKYVEVIFLTCDNLKQPAEVKYLALEIFSRFMLKHIGDLYAHVLSVHGDARKRNVEWNRIIARIEKQIFLRAVSSIQIASKISSHYKVITSAKLRALLKEAGYNFTANSILNSELRILKALNYRVNIPTVVAYTDFFLEVLVHNEPSINLAFLRLVALKVLDVIMVQQQDAYNVLYLNTTKVNAAANSKIQFATVENDLVYLSVVVISCAAFVIRGDESIIHHLHVITAIPKQDIRDFTRILIPFIVN